MESQLHPPKATNNLVICDSRTEAPKGADSNTGFYSMLNILVKQQKQQRRSQGAA